MQNRNLPFILLNNFIVFHSFVHVLQIIAQEVLTPLFLLFGYTLKVTLPHSFHDTVSSLEPTPISPSQKIFCVPTIESDLQVPLLFLLSNVLLNRADLHASRTQLEAPVVLHSYLFYLCYPLPFHQMVFILWILCSRRSLSVT